MSPDGLSNDVVDLQHELTVLRIERDRLNKRRERASTADKPHVDVLMSILDRDIRMREMKIASLIARRAGENQPG
jgi:hypothetical protein